MLHLVAYGVTNMAAFLAVSTVYNATGKEAIRDFAGLSRRAPGLAMVFAVALFSLAGLPIFAGFTSKFYLFTATAAQGLLWLAGLAILMSLVSLYYYLMVIRYMYIEKANDPTPIRVPRLTFGVLGVLMIGIIFMGVYPSPVMEFIQSASDTLFSSEGVLRLSQVVQP
jgi:NADH-quinone oxidoreductase subunit N